MNRKILIAAGGTGGHLYPGIVLARELRKDRDEVLFVIRKKDSVSKVLQREKMRFVEISCAPLLGQSWIGILKSVLYNGVGFFQCCKIIKTFGPQATVGFGAYVSVPVVLASYFFRVPILLHEQNVIPGWSNRFCSVFSKKVAVSFQQTEKYFNGKSLLVGNLVRQEIFSRDREKAFQALGLKKGRLTCLIFGGSAGAKSINSAVAGSLEGMSDLKEKVQFLHLTGHPAETEKLKKRYQECGFHSLVLDYAHDMNDCYAAADLAVCRAGATTVAELIASQTPAILVPYPYAVSGHQIKNAEILQSLGCAEIITESDDFNSRLSSLLRQLIRTDEPLLEMRRQYQRYPIALQSAPIKLAEAVWEVAG